MASSIGTSVFALRAFPEREQAASLNFSSCVFLIAFSPSAFSPRASSLNRSKHSLIIFLHASGCIFRFTELSGQYRVPAGLRYCSFANFSTKTQTARWRALHLI